VKLTPAFGLVRREAVAMRDRRRHQDGDGRRKSERRGLDRHLAAAALDQKNLKEVAVAMARMVQSCTDEREEIVSIWMKSNA